jgi:ERO1-like protein alpha
LTSDVVDATISADARLSLATWRAYDAAAINFCEPDGCVDCDFVDLSINPERHTGFSGKAAKKIWKAVYRSNESRKQRSENENNIFFCSVSGLQSSINIHIASQYRWEFLGSAFGHIYDGYRRNGSEFLRRFHPEMTDQQGPAWLKNLYFVYLLELKALTKVGPQLKNYPFYTGDDLDDKVSLL